MAKHDRETTTGMNYLAHSLQAKFDNVLLSRFIRWCTPANLFRSPKTEAEEKPLAGALKQISLTLRVMGVPPEDPFVERVGSEFRILFCVDAPETKMKSQSNGSGIYPTKSI